ncbi:MAG: hypothetical protein JXK05_09440 [Campylobacterales bacterium]|nr:hypothetical protein [Campylobacterales bacterium]
MRKIVLEVENSAVDKLMWFLEQLKEVVTVESYEINNNHRVNLANDPMAQELKKRIQEIDDGAVELIPHAEIMHRIYAKLEPKCI